jgi:hypothetical protein
MSHTDGARGNELQQLRARLADLEARVSALPGRFTPAHTQGNYRHITQTAHGFIVGNVIRHDGTEWVKSQADTAENAMVGGIVVAVPHPNAFVLAMPGSYLTGLTVTAGINYLSAATAGELTATAPTMAVAVLMADSATSGVLMAGGGGTAFDGEYITGSGTPFAVGTILQPDFVTPAWSDVDEDSARVLGMVVSVSGGMTTVQMSGFVHHDLSSASWWGSLGGGRAYLTPTGGLTNTKPTDPDEFVVPVADVVADVYGRKGIFLLGGAATASELGRSYPLALKWGGGGIDLTTSCTPNGMVVLSDDGENLATNSNAAGHPGIPWQKSEATIEWAIAPTVMHTRKIPFAYDPVANEPDWYEMEDLLPEATVNYQVLAWNAAGSVWQALTLLDAKGELLSHDGTNMVQVDASTARSVFGVAGAVAAVPAPIAATADNQILARLSGSLSWLAAPGTAGHVLTFDGTALAWAEVSRDFPAMKNITTITSDDTFVVPSGKRYVIVILVGGGGGGYGTRTVSSLAWGALTSGGVVNEQILYTSPSASGGGGGMTMIVFDGSILSGETLSITIGDGGAGGGVNASGSAGGDTSLDAPSGTYVAHGGTGGTNVSHGVGAAPAVIQAYDVDDGNLYMTCLPGHDGKYMQTAAVGVSTGGASPGSPVLQGGRPHANPTYGRGGQSGGSPSTAGTAGDPGVAIIITD